MIPGPGPTIIASQPSELAPASIAPGRLIASCSPPWAGPGGHVSGEKPALAQMPHVAGERSRQGPSRALDESDREVRHGLAGRPGRGSQVTVQRDHEHGRRGPGRLARRLDRLDRMLKRRVVQLHHVLARSAASLESPGEVHVHDIEAARSEAQVERLDVHDHFVADLDWTDHALVRPSGATLARDLDRQRDRS